MDAKTLATVLFRVIALYWLSMAFYSLSFVGSLAQSFTEGELLKFFGLVLLGIAPQIVVPWLLWKWSVPLAARTVRDLAVPEPSGSIDLRTATGLAVAVLGLWILSNALPELCVAIFEYINLSAFAEPAMLYRRWISISLRVSIGVAFLVGSDRISYFILNLRGARESR